MHLPCVAKYFQSNSEPRCPHCNDYWPHEIPGSCPQAAVSSWPPGGWAGRAASVPEFWCLALRGHGGQGDGVLQQSRHVRTGPEPHTLKQL